MRKSLILLLFSLLFFCQETPAQLNKDYFFWVGRNYINQSKYQDAIEMINVLLRVDPKAHDAYFLRGIAKYNLDDLLGAEQDFSLAISINPVFTTAYHYRAITRSRLGNYDDALQDFREAIELRPDLPSPYYSRGLTYLLSHQYDKALDDFNMFIRYDNKNAQAYVLRGLAYENLKDTVKAMGEYDMAIRTNRNGSEGYFHRGTLYMTQKNYDSALTDLNQAIQHDSTHIVAYFNRAMLYSSTYRPLDAIDDFTRAIRLDSTSSLPYFNRAILRSQIGDYNHALEDYDKVAFYSPNNVLVFYNRAGLYTQLGNFQAAIDDYGRAIELYPDFANAYLGRSQLRYFMRDTQGAQQDKVIADQKIAEYRSKLSDSTFSIYADTSRHFNQLLSFETKMAGRGELQASSARNDMQISLLPMFKFSLVNPDTLTIVTLTRYHSPKLEELNAQLVNPNIALVNRDSDFSPDSLVLIDRQLTDSLRRVLPSWQLYFERGITQSLIRQYTSSIASYTAAIDLNPGNPFLYLNRSTTHSEMVDFVSSIDNSFQRITLNSDPSQGFNRNSTRIYNYDEAIADLNKAAKLLPDFPYIYYNRGNLECLSGEMAEALEGYTRAIELYPNFGEAYYNRGLIQIFLKDTRKGCLDMSKAGELGISEAYEVLKIYGQPTN